MKCTKCGSTMRKVAGDIEGHSCDSCRSFMNTGKTPVFVGFDKPVDPNNQVVNITDNVDPDLHRKPEK
jgi:hypothetical protein